tara:strand:+ start:3628 stop:6315 length:2688 start_codon:yes stop_codon:yes gene_type:complete
MKLTLNFRDAVITQFNNPGCEYRFEFDLSQMNKPRLSPDARMYIEAVNLPDFVDEVLGAERGKYRGYFEVRCQNIDSGNNYDTEYGNTNNSIIYTAPLDDVKSFRNNDPMFISNFKVSQGFLADKFVLHMKIYDHLGEPFIRGSNLITELGQALTGDYVNKLSAFSAKKDLYDKTKPISDDLELQLNIEKGQNTLMYQQFQKTLNELVLAVQTFIKTFKTLTLRQRLRAEQMVILLSAYNINLFSYLFDDLFTFTEHPYNQSSIQAGIDAARIAFVSYNISNLKLEKIKKTYDEVNSGESRVFYDVNAEFADKKIHLRSQTQKVNYEIPVVGSATKTGTLQITNFNSVKATQDFVSVFNIEPTDTSDANKLFKNEILIVDASNFQRIVPDIFEYSFSKHDAKTPTGTELNLASSGAVKGPLRYAIKVIRNGSTYDYELLDKELKTAGFEVGDKIKFLGTTLGGASPANDMEITINGVFTPQAQVDYSNIEISSTDGTDKGKIIFDIRRTNTAGGYSILSENFTASKNYNIGDSVVIPGIRLGGESPANDYNLQVNDVVLAERIINITQDEAVHVLPDVTITSTNSTTTSSSGANYTFTVSTEDGKYAVDFQPTQDSSTGFAPGDIIEIDGTVLGGDSGANDLKVKVDAVDASASNKITAIDVDTSATYKGRFSTAFKFDVKLTKDSAKFEATYISGGANFEKDDKIKIDGAQLNAGMSGTHDLTITVTGVKADPNVLLVNVIDTFAVSGTANFDTGDLGKIKELSEQDNNSFVEKADGSFTKSQATITSGTPIDIGAQTTPVLNVTLNEDPINGLALIQSDLASAQADLDAAKGTLIPSTGQYQPTFGPAQKQKMRTMNMSLVLYDEVPEYTQASQDAIKGNTYSRIQNCQFKRI